MLTDSELQSKFSPLELARRAVAGGADTIQFRRKSGSTRELIAEAQELRAFCRRHGVAFIVNDRVDVALAAGADGVHLGQEDLPIPLARQLLGPERLIGGSASTAEEAWRCAAQGADYVGFGPVYPTGSKPDAAPVCGLAALESLTGALPVPVIAIGGIDAGNAAALLHCGAHGIAVISAVCCREDPEAAARELALAIEAMSES